MDLPIVQWRTPIALSNCDGLGVRSSPRQKNVPVRAAGEAPNNLNVSTRSRYRLESHDPLGILCGPIDVVVGS
ncbi:hypothetical protein AFLA_004269 [Aspergillus flavus NRRL3357]|nr:hypothetical protein AFLA_004269 [Aspergillus flavus NRRL3357]